MLRLNADLGPAGVDSLRLLLERTIPADAGAVVRLDGSAVDQFGTGTLQVLIAAAVQLKQRGGKLRIESPSPQIYGAARLAGFSWLLEDGPASKAWTST